MSEQVWVGLILLVCWASMPLSLVIANWEFDGDSVDKNSKFDVPVVNKFNS